MEGVRTEKRGGGRRGYAVGIGEAIKVRAAAPEQVRIRNQKFRIMCARVPSPTQILLRAAFTLITLLCYLTDFYVHTHLV